MIYVVKNYLVWMYLKRCTTSEHTDYLYWEFHFKKIQVIIWLKRTFCWQWLDEMHSARCMHGVCKINDIAVSKNEMVSEQSRETDCDPSNRSSKEACSC